MDLTDTGRAEGDLPWGSLCSYRAWIHSVQPVSGLQSLDSIVLENLSGLCPHSQCALHTPIPALALWFALESLVAW